MSRLTPTFAQPGYKALIAYVTVGYPSVEATLKVVPTLAQAGCDAVELGIPFSDPLADGATIQRASYQALLNGVTPSLCLEVAAKLREKVSLPLVFMSYYNPVLRFGLGDFCRASAQAGVDGLIIPDLPPEEGSELEEAAKGHGLDLVYLLAPTSTPERIDLASQRSRGFLYLVSLTGVTGARDRLPPELESFVERVRERAKQPLCVGFGVSTPEEAHRVAQVADGVIVGSRIIELMEGPTPQVKGFIQSLRQALNTKS